MILTAIFALAIAALLFVTKDEPPTNGQQKAIGAVPPRITRVDELQRPHPPAS